MIDCTKCLLFGYYYCCCCRELPLLHRHRHPWVQYYCYFAAVAVAVGNNEARPVVVAAVGLAQLHTLDLPRPWVDSCYRGGDAVTAAADDGDDGEGPGLDNEASLLF